mgnify:CR=1 FL=1|tara:strand:+ start:40 stop:690 length:651 start_codon:yes stop_codon:yes gene_type:complete
MKMNIKIPTSLKDITLKQYKHFLKIQETVEDQRFLNAKMIEILCNVKLDQVMLLRLNDSQEIVKILSNLFDEKPGLVTRFKLNGIEYGFQPQLDELTLGEYIDLDTYIGDWENMEKAMNVLYRPIVVKLKDKYNIEEYKLENDQQLLNMPMDAAMSSIFFLWNLGLDLSRTMTNSLDNQETEALTQYLTSQANGVGTSQFMDSLTDVLKNLKVSLN